MIDQFADSGNSVGSRLAPVLNLFRSKVIAALHWLRVVWCFHLEFKDSMWSYFVVKFIEWILCGLTDVQQLTCAPIYLLSKFASCCQSYKLLQSWQLILVVLVGLCTGTQQGFLLGFHLCHGFPTSVMCCAAGSLYDLPLHHCQGARQLSGFSWSAV